MKKIVYIISMILLLISCGASNEFKQQYKKFEKEIGKNIEGYQLTDEQIEKALGIYTVKYKNKNPNDYIEEKQKNSAEISKEELRDLSSIFLIANYKMNLSLIKKYKNDDIYTEEYLKLMIQQMDNTVINLLDQYNVKEIDENSPVNEFKKTMTVQEYLTKLQAEIGL